MSSVALEHNLRSINRRPPGVQLPRTCSSVKQQQQKQYGQVLSSKQNIVHVFTPRLRVHTYSCSSIKQQQQKQHGQVFSSSRILFISSHLRGYEYIHTHLKMRFSYADPPPQYFQIDPERNHRCHASTDSVAIRVAARDDDFSGRNTSSIAALSSSVVAVESAIAAIAAVAAANAVAVEVTALT